MLLVTVLGEGDGVQSKRQEQLRKGRHGPEERQRELGKQNWLKFQPIFLPWGRDTAFLGLSFLIYQ